MVDKWLDYPTTDLHAHVGSSPSSLSGHRLHSLQGPFSTGSEYLAHYVRALLFKITEFPTETMEGIDVDAVDGATLESIHKQKEKTLRDAARVL